ncbi:unnamed protein product [Cylindrotheca closterium]|uniref:DDE Tnp4 domain-containing protein n=1 Tax=Cylindrotheca closterium TaxID=2856 RepID=A0AAD2CK14_9STRA|nr:unnamed protein product [Cylindrotheca closterium]
MTVHSKIHYSPRAFEKVGKKIGYNSLRGFKSTFGLRPQVCAAVWIRIRNAHGAKPDHLLWALLFLKNYTSQDDLSGRVGCCRNTYSKWTWAMIEEIAALYDSVIVWQNRKKGGKFNKWCWITVDGTDFMIQQPTPFSKKWYSHKFKGPGLRYEVAISIMGGNIVHTNGPFPCGSFPDITIFRNHLVDRLQKGEMAEADLGYRGEPRKIRLPCDWQTEVEKGLKTRARSKQETVNKRFKNWGILKQQYRHPLRDHQVVFRAIVVMTQLDIELGASLYKM